MHLLSKRSNAQSHNDLWKIEDWKNLPFIIQRSLYDYTHMTSYFSAQLDTLSSVLCSDMEIDLSEADSCGIRRWRQIDNANLKYSIYYSAKWSLVGSLILCIKVTRAVNFQIDLRGGQWKTIWFTSGGQFERCLSSVFVGCSKVTVKIILDPTHILKFGEWHAISFLCMHVHTKRYWKILSRVVAINFAQNAQWRNRK